MIKKVNIGGILLLLLINGKNVHAYDSSETVTESNGEVTVEVEESKLGDNIDLYGNYSLYGINRPDSSQVHNLSDGAYSYSVDTQGSTIYTYKVFSGHGGKIRFSAKETVGTSLTSKTYTVYLRDASNHNRVASVRFNKGTSMEATFKGLSTSKKYYLEFTVSGPTYITGKVYKG